MPVSLVEAYLSIYYLLKLIHIKKSRCGHVVDLAHVYLREDSPIINYLMLQLSVCVSCNQTVSNTKLYIPRFVVIINSQFPEWHVMTARTIGLRYTCQNLFYLIQKYSILNFFYHTLRSKSHRNSSVFLHVVSGAFECVRPFVHCKRHRNVSETEIIMYICVTVLHTQ